MSTSFRRRFLLPALSALSLAFVAASPIHAEAQSVGKSTARPANPGNRGNTRGGPRGNASKVPELDAGTGMAAVALLVGGGIVAAGRRRRVA